MEQKLDSKSDSASGPGHKSTPPPSPDLQLQEEAPRPFDIHPFLSGLSAAGGISSPPDDPSSHLKNPNFDHSANHVLRDASFLQAQSTFGNGHVQRMMAGTSAPIQAKLKIGQPNDKYEREADAIADKVMRMPAPEIRPKPT